MIIDMDWHKTWSDLFRSTPPRFPGGKAGRDEFNRRIGWTGWTWQKEFFPNPKNFLGELHRVNGFAEGDVAGGVACKLPAGVEGDASACRGVDLGHAIGQRAVGVPAGEDIPVYRRSGEGLV